MTKNKRGRIFLYTVTEGFLRLGGGEGIARREERAKQRRGIERTKEHTDDVHIDMYLRAVLVKVDVKRSVLGVGSLVCEVHESSYAVLYAFRYYLHGAREALHKTLCPLFFFVAVVVVLAAVVVVVVVASSFLRQSPHKKTRAHAQEYTTTASLDTNERERGARAVLFVCLTGSASSYLSLYTLLLLLLLLLLCSGLAHALLRKIGESGASERVGIYVYIYTHERASGGGDGVVYSTLRERGNTTHKKT